jgi:hypothetical protein
MRLLQTLGLKPPAPRARREAAGDDSGADDPDPAARGALPAPAGPEPDAAGPDSDPIDAELGRALTALEAALDRVTDDALAAPARAELETLKTGRLQAQDVTNAPKRAAAQKTLIAATKRAQVKAEALAARSQAVDKREAARKEVEVTLGQIGAIVLSGMLDDALGKAINKDLGALKARYDSADKLKDMAASEKALTALLEPARALLTRAEAAKEVSDWVTFKFQPLMGSARQALAAVPAAGAKAALQTQLGGLEADRQRYVAATDLAAIQTIVTPIVEQIDKTAKRIAKDAPAIDKSLADLGKLVASFGAAATPGVKEHLKARLDEKTASWPAGTDVTQINASLTQFALALEALRAEVDTINEKQPGTQADKRLKALRKTLELFNETAYSFDDDDRPEATKKGWAFRKRLDEAEAVKDIPARLRLLEAIDRDLHAGLRDLKKTQFKQQLKGKGGKAELDQLIGKMGDATTNPDDLAVCEAAIEACFGVEVKLSSDPAKVKTLPRLYKMLRKVPEWQTHQSEFKQIDFETIPTNTTSFYYPGQARISLDATGGGGTTRNKIPEYDPAAKEVKADYFNFTTLHEVGHSVDDKINFMDTNGKDVAYGGWKSETIDSIVDHFGAKGGFYGRHEKGKATRKDLKKLLESVLTTKAASKPSDAKKSLGSLIDRWDEIMKDPIVVICTSGVLEADEVWNGGAAKAAAIAVAGRVCHQSQANDWYSYQLSARQASGVSHYQWRAPAEWFAEIYAMYYMDELKASHPMYAWFASEAKSEKSAKKKPEKAKGK